MRVSRQLGSENTAYLLKALEEYRITARGSFHSTSDLVAAVKEQKVPLPLTNANVTPIACTEVQSTRRRHRERPGR